MVQKVLIVDDDSDLRQTLMLVLAPLCDVLECSNGSDALRLIARERPSLMLLDVAMPEMDGLDVLKSARELDPALTVVMLTGEDDVGTAKRALDGGARAYMTKPFESSSLRDSIRRELAGLLSCPTPYRPWRVQAC